MAKAPQTAQPPKTALAQIYSHPYGEIGGVNHNPIANILPYKSGLSPSTLPPNATPQDKIERAALERVYSKGVRIPALKLATLMLNNCHTWPWWDAYLSENFTFVGISELPQNENHIKHFRFRDRPNTISNNDQERQKMMDKLNRLGKEVEFGIFSQYTDAKTGYDDSVVNTGETNPPTIWRKTQLSLSFELIESLLKPETLLVEKLLIREEIACTLLHELTFLKHALWYDLAPGRGFVPEPYYEEEIIAELGFSMENAIFGGLHEGINRFVPASGVGLAGFLRATVLNKKPPGWKSSNFYPVPTQHYSNLNNINYWDLFVKQYGQSVTHMGPRMYGSRYDAGAKVRTASTNFPDGGFEADVVIKDTMTVDEKQRVDFENDRRAKCNRTAELFTWRELNSAPAATHGFVVRIDAGWPTPPPPQQVQPIDADVRQLFRRGFTNTVVNKQLFGMGYEFDKDLLRSLMNKFLYDEDPTNKQFSEDEFDKYIAYFASQNLLCEPGAKGIIRRL
ncbi:hypothetical protein L207DRAFT_595459 [Hyaloscypha variabilis F]|uniref:Uncharacterized protein n=1 Tax=Hyaloscypha variabilis (strain UAMH 11265 / GT02V1 / F) TaxID=1149755 RepID=A0A2J6SDV2_HYAVF|nr:hypothetical protein L207DRAFT_595459 [Hyaloscypha variabilis F]